MEDKTKIILGSIFGITILGSIYLLTGHNSIGFALMISSIAGLGGWIIPSPFKK
jgi:hypothetical protein